MSHTIWTQLPDGAPIPGTPQIASLYVTNVAALRALAAAPTENLFYSTLYYATPGDGGHADYRWDSASTATDDGGATIKITAVTTGRFRLLIGADGIHVDAFGAGTNDGADVTTKVQAAITALPATGGTVNFSPNKSYSISLVSATLANTTLSGGGSATIVPIGSGNIFEFYNSGGQKRGCKVDGFLFSSATIRTAGAAINVSNFQDVTVSRCRFYNQFDCIKLASFGAVKVRECVADEFAGALVRAEFGDTLMVSNCTTGQASVRTGSRGISMTRGGGLYVENSDFVTAERGIELLPGAAVDTSWIFLTNVSLDTCTYGLYADAGSGTLRSIHSANSWYSSCTEQGVRIINCDGISFNNDRILQNHKEGMFVGGAAKNIQLTSLVVCDNSVATSNTYSGVFLDASVDKITIQGGQYGNNYAGATVNNQKYGVELNSGSAVDLQVTGVRFSGNLTAPLNFQRSLTSDTVVIKDNTSSVSAAVTAIAALVIDLAADRIRLTGTTAVTSIGLHPRGKQVRVTLATNGGTITNGGNMVLTGDFTGNAGSLINLVCDGATWFEEGRNVI